MKTASAPQWIYRNFEEFAQEPAQERTVDELLDEAFPAEPAGDAERVEVVEGWR